MPTPAHRTTDSARGQRWSCTAPARGATIPPSPARSGPASPRVAAGAQHRARGACGPGGGFTKSPVGEKSIKTGIKIRAERPGATRTRARTAR